MAKKQISVIVREIPQKVYIANVKKVYRRVKKAEKPIPKYFEKTILSKRSQDT